MRRRDGKGIAYGQGAVMAALRFVVGLLHTLLLWLMPVEEE